MTANGQKRTLIEKARPALDELRRRRRILLAVFLQWWCLLESHRCRRAPIHMPLGALQGQRASSPPECTAKTNKHVATLDHRPSCARASLRGDDRVRCCNSAPLGNCADK